VLATASSLYRYIGLADPDGTVRCGSTAGAEAAVAHGDVSATGWFQRARRERGYVVEEYGREQSGAANALMAAHPVDRPGGRRAVLFVELDTSRLARSVNFEQSGGDTSFLVIDGRGTVALRLPALPGVVGRRLPGHPLLRTVLRRRSGVAELPGLDGVQRIQGFAPVGGRGESRLFAVVGQGTESVFAEPSGDLQRYLLLAGIGLVLALLTAWAATKLLLGRWSEDVVQAARRFGAGDLTARAPVPRGAGELTDIATALNAAAAEIERREVEQARLLAELVVAEEETRRRIALDIHDDTAQAVAAAGLRIDALVADLRGPEEREAAANARTALAEANRRLRRLLFELRPPALDQAGLAAALDEFLTDSFGDDGFDWRVENRLDREPAPDTRAILYRVALEALTNVRNHASANLVEVLLERRGVGVAVTVRDDGAGFELPAPDAPVERGHMGLVSMRERAEAAGGRLALASRPGEGTTVDFWMPEPNGRGPS
jgi:signal transduction histidine kinase